jgi:hypothetical protein
MKVLYAVDGIFFDFMVLIALLWHREIHLLHTLFVLLMFTSVGG